MTARPRTKTERTAPSTLEALVRGVVARVVEVRGTDRAARGRVEEHDIRVTPDLEGTLRCEAEPSGRRRREQVDHPLDGDAAAGHALRVEDRQQRLDAGRPVADLVERHASTGLGLLDTQAVRDVIGRHQVQRAIGQASPQGIAIRGGPERRRDDEAGTASRVGLVVALLGQDQVVRAGLGRDPDAGRLGAADLVERGRGREMDDVHGRLGEPGEGQRPGGRHGLDVWRARAGMEARCGLATGQGTGHGGVQQDRVLAVDLEHPAVTRHDAASPRTGRDPRGGSRRP